jgi:DNA-binding CsgD family transcriptional regulator
VNALTDAIEELPPADRELGLLLEATRVSAGHSTLPAWHRLRTARRRFDVSGQEPRTLGEEMRVAELALVAALRGTAGEAASLAGAAIAGGRLRASKETRGNAYIFAPSALLFADELEDATQVLGQVMTCARHFGWSAVLSAAAHLRALAWWRRGDLGEVEADARLALDGIGYHQTPHGALALVEALLARGDVAAAAQAWDDAELDAERDRGISEIIRLHTRGRLANALGRPGSALDDLYACGRLEREWDVRTPALGNWRVDAVPILVALGRGAEARALAEEELDAARAFGSARALGAALRAMAGVEGGERALELLRESVAVLEPSAARLEHALALAELGAALRRAGRRTEARAPLCAAIELALECGAHGLRNRAHDALVAAGARPRRDPIDSRSNLTASELRVARMAADGMTNRAIAQALFVTEKTVENHLGSCYRKLDIRSRSQLGRALAAAA